MSIMIDDGLIFCSPLAPLGDRHIGELRDVPQEPYRLANGELNHNQIAIDAFRAAQERDDFDERPRLWISEASLHAAMTAEQRHKAWSEWRAGWRGQQLLQAVAAGEVEFGDALKDAFIGGLEAALKP